MAKYRVETHLIDENNNILKSGPAKEWAIAAELDTDGTFSKDTDQRFRGIYSAVMRRIREQANAESGEGGLVDKIGQAAADSRGAGYAGPNYNPADTVDQMVLLYEILKELRKLNEVLRDAKLWDDG